MKLQKSITKKTVISRTDRIVIGVILHEIRKEFGIPICFYTESTRGGSNESALPRQIAYYLSNVFTCTTTQLGLSKFFKCNNGNIIHAINKIENLIHDNRTFQYMMRRISKKVEDSLESKICN